MHSNKKRILLISLPFAETTIPSIQISLLETYLRERNVKVTSKHLYLKAADIYGLHNYNRLIFSTNGSYAAQIAFSKYVFPEHWRKSRNKICKYYDKKINSVEEKTNEFTFDNYIHKTDLFCEWVLKNIEWNLYDIVGFSINFGQFLPSLAIAKKIKEICPEKIVVFGGSRTCDIIGIKTLEVFDYIDFIVSGDGEDALYLLASDFDNHQKIPGLIYRKEKQIHINRNDECIDLNDLPNVSYDSYFQDLSNYPIIQQFFDYYGKLPIELSRGCWWNKCTFCNVKLQNKKYREKNIEKFIRELIYLSEKYQILNFQIISNLLPIQNYRYLFDEIIKLNKDFTLNIESRANRLTFKDYVYMKKAGFSHIQTGIETFSSNYIKKMNKGTRVIDNIATLKFSKENDIINDYNIVINYPNEEDIDYIETKNTIQLFKQYIDPPKISSLVIGFGSHIFNNPDQYNIENLEFTPIDKLMFPLEILDRGISYFYHFNVKKDIKRHDWEQLIDNWQKERNQNMFDGLKSKLEIDKFTFYFEDGGNFLKIYDKRDNQNIHIYTLDEIERELFLACINITSAQELFNSFSKIPDYKLGAILNSLEKKGILYKEDDFYLSLPLRTKTEKYKWINDEPQILIHNSGKQRTL